MIAALVRVLTFGPLLFIVGCASAVRDPLPAEFANDVTVLGRSDLRVWGDGVHQRAFANVHNDAELEAKYGGIMHRSHDYLVISGGGANGAYGAGVLLAWTEMGTRPEFTMVTGVSTGALTAPFAFLGPEYDAALKEVYTTLDTTQLVESRGMLSVIGGDALLDTTPLSKVLDRYIDDKMLARLAEEHHKGRILAVATTNLDAARPVVWNITRIAASGHAEAGQLIRQALLASASIPGAFPPVYISVEAPDGKTYDEMHVDGGVSSQMFFYPAGVDWRRVEELLNVKGKPKIHVVRNAFLHAEHQSVDPRLVPIAGRTISSLIRTQGIGDFFRIWTLAERDGMQVEVSWIPDSFRENNKVVSDEVFDPDYMKALFEFGYQRTLAGNAWQDFDELVGSIDRIDLLREER